MAEAPKPLPFHYQFLCGAIAGISEILTMYPLDVVKTRAQLNTGASVSIGQAFKQIIKTEGVGALYRGIIPPILVEAPKRATKFAANEQYTALYKRVFGFDKLTQGLAVMTGVSAGITEAFLIVPFELVKIRMQDKANVSFPFFFCVRGIIREPNKVLLLIPFAIIVWTQVGKYNGTMDTFGKIIKKEGPLALFNGLEATIWRHASWNGGYFGVIFGVKGLLPQPKVSRGYIQNKMAIDTVVG
ncbi:mitochondrial carrier domain-containing protein [Phycomyces nitens]|nr:mitochondrial carrier domain-containing protein [Phycomyces nitens]